MLDYVPFLIGPKSFGVIALIIFLGSSVIIPIPMFASRGKAQVAWLAHAASIDLGAPITRLRVDGGLTRSTALMQVQADLIQAPIEVYPSPNATALGVAALACLGAGGVANARVATGGWRPAAVYEPTIDADAAAERLQDWRTVAEATLAL